jgi:hypothetical protein
MLKKWCQTNNFFNEIQNEQKIEMSHLLLDGGIIYLPKEKEYEFLKLYVADVENKTKLYVVEVRQEIFRYMIDLDIGATVYWSDEDVIEISKSVNFIVNKFYRDMNLSCIICKSAKKVKIEDNKEFIHTGVHILYPKLFVKSETAIMMREAIIQYLTKNPIEQMKTITSNLEIIFDKRIYISNGFRMVYSDKIYKHPETGKKIPENREYYPIAILNHENDIRIDYLNRLISDKLSLMCDTSTRYVPHQITVFETNGMLPTSEPEWFKYDKPLLDTVKKKIKLLEGISDLEFYNIKKHIEKVLPVYKNSTIFSIKRYPDTGLGYNCILICLDSKYCLNLDREHKSCGVYLYASKNGICQKCLCPCENLSGRKHGLCSKYTSEYYPFSSSDIICLFPESEESKNKYKQFLSEIEKNKNKLEKDEAGEKSSDNSSDKNEKNEKHTKDTEPTPKPKPKKPKITEPYRPGMGSEKHKMEELLKSIGTFERKMIDTDSKKKS